jgi:hypothetical protein
MANNLSVNSLFPQSLPTSPQNIPAPATPNLGGATNRAAADIKIIVDCLKMMPDEAPLLISKLRDVIQNVGHASSPADMQRLREDIAELNGCLSMRGEETLGALQDLVSICLGKGPVPGYNPDSFSTGPSLGANVLNLPSNGTGK